MSNIECDYGATLVGRTYSNDEESTLTTVPKELARNLQIENSKVSMSPMKDFDGNKHLGASKYYNEIVLTQETGLNLGL